MNIWVFIVACITLSAFLAHVVIGTKETATLEPVSTDGQRTTHWVQAMCAFQMLSVDLLVVAAALFGIAFLDLGPLARPVILLFGLLFFLWGVVWLIQMKVLHRTATGLWRLPHWFVWFVCSGLLLLGS
ncbi:hypothetical protein GCM10007385_21210 [Tateyamaria omphalii]|uniref:hypothetical protein n=1 Tax=Tateyamaria omphalii TaxID=299262 RepID=UPI001676C098|nr:hypothetical protein [Tateyamaria omphalii]GGX52297.1 hypothetical protein GCM10007385_21210 [Tateyamaria omphalii]